MPSRVADPAELPAPEAGADEVGEAVDEILRGPEFREPERTLPQQIVDWIEERIGDAVGTLVQGGTNAVVGWLILVALLAVLVFLLVRFAAGMQAAPARPGPRPDAERRRPAREWRREAEAHEAAGEWRQALRCRYRALIADLAARGVVEEVPGRTAGEYRAELGRRLPRSAADFAQATMLFEGAWYGDHPTGAGDLDTFRRLSEAVTRAVEP